MAKIVKNKNDEVVTRGILEFELKKGFDKFGKNLDTKLDKRFDDERRKNIAFFASKQDIQDAMDAQGFRTNIKLDKLVTGVEKLYAKFEKKEQEGAMHGYAHRLAEDKLANHDKRIEKLEKARAVA